MRLRNTVRNIVSAAARTKARLQNPAVEFGPQCRVSWSVQFCGTNRIVFGTNCALRYSAIFSPGSGDIHFGDDCSVGPFCYLDGHGGLVVGNKVMIGPHVGVYSSNHIFSDVEQPLLNQGLEKLGVTIGDDVWIGSHAVILAGVQIGNGVVVAAGAVVTRDIPARSVVAGVPARVLKTRA